jgi:kynureninase
MPELLEKARYLDGEDALQHYRKKFHLPTDKQGKPLIYFCGNSLGLQPAEATRYLDESLKKWQQQAVEGHFQQPDPWLSYHKLLKKPLAHICGAREHEVVSMNNLTTNLHLMMVSFYRPSATRYKIMLEAGAFPSDQYAVESQVRFHGFEPEEAIVEMKARTGEETLRTEDILHTIEQQADTLALVLFPGVQYYSGQLFDMERITAAAHQAGARAGFDLAHAVGNVPLQLHDWNVDFAVWCSYKYLNSGPGNNGGAFVHERYAKDPDLPRFAGWWGHDEAERFRMEKGFKPMYGVDGWQLSNVNILSTAVQRASLEIIAEAGMDQLRKKSIRLTAFLEECIHSLDPEAEHIRIISPANPEERGCQLSMLSARYGKRLFEQLTDAGIVVDWREPDVIRVAPTPLYNTFEEVYRFYEILKNTLDGSR